MNTSRGNDGFKEYDTMISGDQNCFYVLRMKGGEWQKVKLFWTEKEAKDWLKGGVAPTRYVK